MTFGVYGRLEAAPAELVAFVVPHGVLEVSAIVLAGALGLSLGATAWRRVRGRASRRELADAVDRGFWVLVGLAVVLVVAGLIEGFVSPYYYRPSLGTCPTRGRPADSSLPKRAVKPEPTDRPFDPRIPGALLLFLGLKTLFRSYSAGRRRSGMVSTGERG